MKTLVAALSRVVPANLAQDLVAEFVEIRQDVQAGRIGGGAPGKFVETVAQVLQQLELGRYDAVPNVDQILRFLESRPSPLDDGLRVCMPRIARAMYALRNKRAIVHKGPLDPNAADLAFLHAGAQWIVAELVRHASGIPMDEAAEMARAVQAPIGGMVEDFDGTPLVLQELTTREEVLVILHQHYPETVSLRQVTASMDRRRPDTVRRVLRDLWAKRIVQGDPRNGYVLTRTGLAEALKVTHSPLDM